MQIKIYIEEKYLDELSTFLQSKILYEHTIQYYTVQPSLLETVEVYLFYSDYVQLEDLKIKNGAT